MLSNELFALLLGAVLLLVVFWACKRLPEEPAASPRADNRTRTAGLVLILLLVC
jgi:hypothetical protein